MDLIRPTRWPAASFLRVSKGYMPFLNIAHIQKLNEKSSFTPLLDEDEDSQNQHVNGRAIACDPTRPDADDLQYNTYYRNN